MTQENPNDRFGMKKLHEFLAIANKDEYVSVLHVASHLLMDSAYEGVDSFAHVCL